MVTAARASCRQSTWARSSTSAGRPATRPKRTSRSTRPIPDQIFAQSNIQRHWLVRLAQQRRRRELDDVDNRDRLGRSHGRVLRRSRGIRQVRQPVDGVLNASAGRLIIAQIDEQRRELDSDGQPHRARGTTRPSAPARRIRSGSRHAAPAVHRRHRLEATGLGTLDTTIGSGTGFSANQLVPGTTAQRQLR